MNYRDRYYISYIGETGVSFYARIKEHLIRIMGGDYESADPESLAVGEAKPLWRGMWRKDTRDKMNEFMDIYAELAPKIIRSISAVRMFLGALEGCGQVDRRLIEGALAHHLRSQTNEIKRFLPDDIRYLKMRVGQRKVRVSITCPVEVIGLPSQIVIR
ncbi:MAG: hypothetical protein Q8P50_02780 [Bacillota bacterium]|nr:hypothetical protein [Bacillota bacterium]